MFIFFIFCILIRSIRYSFQLLLRLRVVVDRPFKQSATNKAVNSNKRSTESRQREVSTHTKQSADGQKLLCGVLNTLLVAWLCVPAVTPLGLETSSFPFPLLWSSLPPFFQVWPFLSFMVLPFPLCLSSLSSLSSMILPFPLYCSCLSSLSSMALPFHLQFHLFLPSLPWFFLSLFIHHFFLVRSSALAVQALLQAHDMKWFLKGSTIFPSLCNRSRSLKLTFK